MKSKMEHFCTGLTIEQSKKLVEMCASALQKAPRESIGNWKAEGLVCVVCSEYIHGDVTLCTDASGKHHVVHKSCAKPQIPDWVRRLANGEGSDYQRF